MSKVWEWLRGLPVGWFILLWWVLNCLYKVGFNALLPLLGVQMDLGDGGMAFEAPLELDMIFVVVLVGPLVETFLFQAAPYHLLRLILFFRRRTWLVIMVSALFFALLHCYSWVYVVFTIVPGFFYAGGYHLRYSRESSASFLYPFGTIFTIYAVHALTNATPTLYRFAVASFQWLG